MNSLICTSIMPKNFWKTAFTLFAILQVTQAWEFVCYNSSLSDSKSVSYPNAAELIESGYFDVDQKALVYAHGYRGSLTTQGTNKILDAHIQLGDRTVCAIDWSIEANFGFIPYANFPVVIAAAKVVQNELAKALRILYQNGMKPENVHLMGLSLGAHLLGNTGREFHELTNKKIARVTGFEPAKPGYEGAYPMNERIDQTCADFVDIIHTDPDRYGMKEATGHIDFYPNPIEYERNGVQPGCPYVNYLVNPPLSSGDACSHRRSLDLYLDSMIFEGRLLAVKAPNQKAWGNSTITDTDEVTYIGERIDQTLRGKFYLRTAEQSPYGLCEDGLTAE